MSFMTKRNGFTVIEMLVVIVILGILASLAAFGFRGWQQGITQRQAQSELGIATAAMESAKNFGNGYPSSLPPTYKPSDGITLTYVGGNATTYCIEARGTQLTSVVYYIDSAVGKTPVVGTCGSAYQLNTPSPSIASITSSSMVVSWGSITGATSYEVKYGPATPSSTASCSSSPCTLSGLSSSTNYKVTVRAISQYNSKTSAEINATTTGVLVATSISAGLNNGCAMSGGGIYCWGNNGTGQLGNNSTTNSSKPVAVDTSGVLSGRTITAITSGYSHNCALASGAVYCWGYNGAGQLGNNSTANSSVPVAVNTAGVLNGKTVTHLAAGRNYTCAVATNLAYCWGENVYGQLGNNSTTNSSVPVAVYAAGVLSGRTVTFVDANVEHACVIASGAAYCWGSNWEGRLGNNATAPNSTVPVAVYTGGVLSGKTITHIDGGLYSTCATATDGASYCWGDNDYGSLGNNSTTDSTIPVAVSTALGSALNGKTVTATSFSVLTACALATDGKAYCWGRNSYGNLGNNTYTDSSVPVAVNTSGVLSGRTLTSVVSGANFACGMASGNVYCWGINNWGQLGNNTTTDSPVPVQVSNP